MNNKIKTVALAAITTAALAGCSSNAISGSTHNAQVIARSQKSDVSKTSVEQAFLNNGIQARRYNGDVEFLAPGENPGDLTVDAGCGLDAVMTTPEEVSAYQGDSWLVVNPAGTVGVKVGGTEEAQTGCMQEAADILKNVK